MTPIALYRTMSSRYPIKHDCAVDKSPHELFTALDFEVRFLAVLANSVLRADDGPGAPRLGRGPGLGEWISYLRQCRDPLNEVHDSSGKAVVQAVNAALAAYDGGIAVGLGNLTVPKRLRDHLSHGGAVPDAGEVSKPLAALIGTVDSAIQGALDSASLQYVESAGVVKPALRWSREVPLWPLIYGMDGSWCLFGRFATNTPSYLSYGTSAVQATRVPDDAISALNRILVAPGDRQVGQFRKDVVADLSGFTEDGGANLILNEREHGFEVTWRKATGTGEGFEERLDYFRLGPDNVRQWRAPTGWSSYSGYLRQIANWPLLARRIRLSLDEASAQLASEESINLGWAKREGEIHREARVLVSDMDGSNQKKLTFTDLLSDVDADLQANRPQTQVVFINGEAGIGKTRAMIDAARKRALAVEPATTRDAADLPLLLYVGSTGQVLSQLDQVVAAAVASTRSLTPPAVKALCRNGLFVLLVDGFDELLGNVRYNDALGSLQPWLEDLGGRGIIVVSARSSYYVGQYKASVERAQGSNGPNVHHCIAEIQRWSHDEIVGMLIAMNVDITALDDLSAHDRDLLGLPFFARAFAEMCLNDGDELPKSSNLSDHLMDQYLAREEAKVLGDDGTSIISRIEIRTMFEFVAEFMDENSEREADDEALKTAAEFAIEDALDTRGGLLERLPALCGFAVNTQGGKRRFRFQHELFYDQFLGDAISRYIDGGRPQPRFQSLVSASVWRPATVARVSDSLTDSEHASLLSGQLGIQDSSTAKRQTASANVGNLWLSLIQRTGRMDFTIRNARFIDDLDLRDTRPGVLNILDSEIETLILPDCADWQINLSNSTIKKIHAQGLQFEGLKGIDSSRVLQILTKNMLIERKDEVRAALVSNGAEVVDPARGEDASLPVNVEAAEVFLSRAIDRSEYYWILLKNHRAPDTDPQVVKRTEEIYGRRVWLDFVRALLDADLAEEDTITGSGAAKVRVRLTKNASHILDREDDERIVRFWSLLSS